MKGQMGMGMDGMGGKMDPAMKAAQECMKKEKGRKKGKKGGKKHA